MFVVQVRLLSILMTDKIYSQAASLEKDLPELAVVKSEFICSEYREAAEVKVNVVVQGVIAPTLFHSLHTSTYS